MSRVLTMSSLTAKHPALINRLTRVRFSAFRSFICLDVAKIHEWHYSEYEQLKSVAPSSTCPELVLQKGFVQHTLGNLSRWATDTRTSPSMEETLTRKHDLPFISRHNENGKDVRDDLPLNDLKSETGFLMHC